MSAEVRQPRRKGRRFPSKEPAGQAVEELAWLARIPQENPDPVFRVSAAHVLLYSNPAGEELCRRWGCRLGQKVPEVIRAIISATLAEGVVARHKVVLDSRVYGLSLAPSVADGYVHIYVRDITDYKRAEDALRQAERRFRTIFDTTSDGIFLHDLETRKLVMGNKSCLRMLGYTEDEFTQLSVADLHPEADLPFVYAQIEKFLQGGRPIRHDIRFRRKDGSFFFADVSPDLVRLDGKRYMVVALKDITERKRAEEALAASERKYRSLVENIPDVTWTADREGHTLFISANVRELYGYSPEEICAGGDAWRGDVHPDDRPRIEKAFGEMFAGNATFDVEYRIRRKDGHWIWLRDRSVKIYEKDGQWYADGICSDITERRRMEEELRQHTEHLAEMVEARTREVQESERRYRSLAENAPDVIQRFDRDLRRLYVNPAFEQATGLSPHAVIGRMDRELALPKNLIPFWERAAQTVFRTGESRIIVFEMPTPRGPRHFEAHLVPEFGPDGAVEHLLAITRDITERVQAQESLRFTQFAVDHTADAAFWMTEEGRFFYVNEAACRALGYSRAELLQMTVYDIDPAFTEDMWRASWRRLKAEKSIVLETVHRARDGRTYPVEIRANYLEFGGREYDCALARDITERKRAEEALRESEAGLAAAQRLAHIGSWQWDIATDTARWSAETFRIFGIAPGPLQQHREGFLSRIVPEDQRRVDQALSDALSGARDYDLDYRIGLPDGRERVIHAQAQVLRSGDGRPVRMHGTVQDVTERRQAEEALRRLNERLELQVAQRTEELRHTVDRLQQLTLELSQAEDRERKRIADILHDDVQQTLAAAKFHLNLLSSEPRSAEESREIVELVKHMLKDAIEKSRRLSHELSPALYQVDLTAILEWLARHMQQRHGLTVHVEAHGPVDSPAEPLKAFLYKVAQELLFNVVKHAGVREARLRVRRLGSRLYLSVVDRGRGFSPQGLETTPGFGLLGIRERVQLLGGRMKIKSAPGAGSTLLIAVPYEASARVARPA